MLPRRLVLLRHGESEKSALADTDDRLRNPQMLHRHDSTFRVTEHGGAQARAAGRWLKRHISGGRITSFHVSPYDRTRATAALLDLHGAAWRVDLDLRERDFGRGMVSAWPGRDGPEFVEYLARRASSPMFARSVGGNALADVIVQVRLWLQELRREAHGGVALAVCHSEVMRAAHCLLAGLTPEEYADWERSTHIEHCDLFEYTRASPDDERSGIADDYSAWRWVSTTDQDNDPQWQPLSRRRFSNHELLASIGGATGRS